MLATGEVKCIDEEVPFEIPQGWEWERIGNLFETTSGSTPLSRNPDYYQNGSINWVRTTDLNNGVLCKTEIQITEKACSDYNLTILPQNSVCIAMYGGAGTIGKHSILQFDTTINQSVCAIKPNGYCNMDYLHTFIEYQRPYWMDFAAGSRKDPNINQLIIKHCLLPIPPQKEQTRIVEKLSLLHPYITQYGECQIKLDYINKEILDKFISFSDEQIGNYKTLRLKSNKFFELLKGDFKDIEINNSIQYCFDADWSNFLNILKKQKISLLGVLKDDWSDRFNRYKTDINNIKSVIADTDKKIDTLVYQLYGLTDDEIKIIEESLKNEQKK